MDRNLKLLNVDYKKDKKMLIDTHCHLNMIVKEHFDVPLTHQEILAAQSFIDDAARHAISIIINVGTSLIESINSIHLAKHYQHVHAAVGIHPNDLTENWQYELKQLEHFIQHHQEHRIVAIGECGLDKHYPNYNAQRQQDAFKAQIEMALKYDLALIIHSRNAYDETLHSIEAYKDQITRGIIHCFSEDQDFADTVIAWNFAIGLGGTITYPKNNVLREIAKKVPLANIVLETDAPFLPPQAIRGKQNTPKEIATIARYLADLREDELKTIAETTTNNCRRIFNLVL